MYMRKSLSISDVTGYQGAATGIAQSLGSKYVGNITIYHSQHGRGIDEMLWQLGNLKNTSNWGKEERFPEGGNAKLKSWNIGHEEWVGWRERDWESLESWRQSPGKYYAEGGEDEKVGERRNKNKIEIWLWKGLNSSWGVKTLLQKQWVNQGRQWYFI